MKNKHLSIVGFGKDREEKDFYPTPPETTEALFEREKFEGNVLEPACGNGSMSEIIKKYNSVHSQDLFYRGYGISLTMDFTKCEWKKCFDNVITNPPYRFAKEFVLVAKKVATKKIAMLLKLVFLEGIGRYEMFRDKEFPLKTVYVFCRRQKIYKAGIIGKNSGLIAYAWFVWDKGYKGKPVIEWIP